MLKQLIITFFLFWLFQAWFAFPQNKLWWNQRIAAYYKDYKKEKSKTKWENRWKERHSYNYSVPKDLSKFLSEQKDTLLLPPKKYFTKIEPQLDPLLQWLDIRWFYYMADKKIPLTFLGDQKLQNATQTILFDKQNGFYLFSLKNQTQKDSLISVFQKANDVL
ncbi:MAG: hypothetical protein SNJ77_08065 [Cytophagales bacterium]